MALVKYLFYVPFYFQSAQLVDAMESGIRAMPLGLFQIVAVVICSSLVTYTGHYVSRRHGHGLVCKEMGMV